MFAEQGGSKGMVFMALSVERGLPNQGQTGR